MNSYSSVRLGVGSFSQALAAGVAMGVFLLIDNSMRKLQYRGTSPYEQRGHSNYPRPGDMRR